MQNVKTMSPQERLREVLTRSKKYCGPDVIQMIDSLISPTNLGIISGSLLIWITSQAFGVGEIVDVLLLAVGAFSIGWSITDVAKDLYEFARLTIKGNNDRDLDLAAQAFAHAVTLAGMTVIMAILLHKSVKEIQAVRGTNALDAIRLRRSPGLQRVGVNPFAGQQWSKPSITIDPTMPAGEGSTSWFGEVRLSPLGSITEQALARAHELVHQFLTPRLGVLRTFRVQLRASGYMRTMLLKYLEEALAETIAQLRINGFRGLLTGVKFPVKNGYMTITALKFEASVIGTIMAGGQLFHVTFIPTSSHRSHHSHHHLH